MPERVIAIDGPVGSGKTTLGLGLAEKLKADFLDTGSTFRALALEAKSRGIDPDNLESVTGLLESVIIRHGCRREKVEGVMQVAPYVTINGREVTGRLFEEEIGDLASRLSAISEVRAFARKIWRGEAGDRLLIAAGRDLTSVVFPEAVLKIYLDCTLGERARRRAVQLRGLGVEVSDEEIEAQLAARDRRDMGRETDPLVRTRDSCYISTDTLDPEQTVRLALRFYQRETKGAEVDQALISDHYRIPARTMLGGSLIVLIILLGFVWGLVSRSGSDGAIADWRKLRSFTPEKREGLKRYKQGDDAGAEELFLTALEQDPADPEVLNYLGIISARKGELEQAGGYFQRSAEADPEQSEAFVNLAVLARYNRDLETTESLLNRALQNDRDSYLIKTSIEEVELFQGKTAPTLDTLKRIHSVASREMGEADPDMEDVVQRLRLVATKVGEVPLEESAQQGEVDMMLGSALNLLGVAAARDGEATEAKFYFRLAISSASGLPAPYNNLGAAYEHEGDLVEAHRFYGMAVEISEGKIPAFVENQRRVEEMLK